MAGTRKERIGLAGRINAVQFREYSKVGWLKVVVLHGMVRYDRAEQAIIHSWTVERQDDDRLRLEALDLILDNEMTWSVPESIGTPSLAWGAWRPVTEPEARRAVDAILQHTDPKYPATVPYARLRDWFFDSLFDPDAVRFFSLCVAPYDRRYPIAVAGIDHDMVALFWLE